MRMRRIITLLLTVALVALTLPAQAADLCYRLDPFGTLLHFDVAPVGAGFSLSGTDPAAPDRVAYGTVRHTPDGGTRVAFSIVGDAFARHVNGRINPGTGSGPFTAADGLRGTLVTIDCSNGGGPPPPPRGPLNAAAAPAFVTGVEVASAAFDAVGTKLGQVVSVSPEPVVLFEVDGTRFALHVTRDGFRGDGTNLLFFEATGCQGTALLEVRGIGADRVLKPAAVIGMQAYFPDESAPAVEVLFNSFLTGDGCHDQTIPPPTPMRPALLPPLDLGALFVPPFSVR